MRVVFWNDRGVPKNWSKGLTKQTDPRVARAAEGHRGLRYTRHSSTDRRRGPGSRLEQLTWSPALAYAVGLAATDGCLVNTCRHVAFVSTDLEQMQTFLECIGRPRSAIRSYGNIYRVQLGDVDLYRWLSDAGLTPRKSLTLGAIYVPEEMFFDLVRGLLDGDGSIRQYVHRPVARDYPHYLYRRLNALFHSASFDHLVWLQAKLRERLGIKGALLTQTKNRPHNLYVLKYGKYASIALLTKLYEDPTSPRLLRKWLIWEDFKMQPVTTRPYRSKTATSDAQPY
jgi:hypothetical protein